MKNKTLWTATLLYIIFVMIAILIIKNNSYLKSIDTIAFKQLSYFSQNYHFFAIITKLGAPKFVNCIVILLLFFAKNKKQQLFLFASVWGNSILNYILKNLIQRPRPSLHHLASASGFSFPSGHSMATASLLLAFSIIYYQNTHKKQIFFYNALLFLIIIVSRPILHVHYLSDVLAGSCLAIANVLVIKHFIFDNRSTMTDSCDRNTVQ